MRHDETRWKYNHDRRTLNQVEGPSKYGALSEYPDHSHKTKPILPLRLVTKKKSISYPSHQGIFWVIIKKAFWQPTFCLLLGDWAWLRKRSVALSKSTDKNLIAHTQILRWVLQGNQLNNFLMEKSETKIMSYFTKAVLQGQPLSTNPQSHCKQELCLSKSEIGTRECTSQKV